MIARRIINTEAIVYDYVNQHPSYIIKYKKHDKNQGKGVAIASGVQLATGDYLIIQDADLEYNPKEFNNFIEADD